MKKQVGLAVGILLAICLCMAAKPVPYTFDVQGLIFGNKYTDAQTRAKLGKNPLSYKTWFDGEMTTRTYQFGTEGKSNEIRFTNPEQDEFSGFSLKDSTFSLFEGHLKVSDTIAKVSQLGGGLLVFNENLINNRKLYYFYPTGEMSELFLAIVTEVNGTIFALWAEPPI